MTQYNHILASISDGRQMQFKDDDQWQDIDTQDVFKKLAISAPAENFRVKPITIRIGDIDVPEPLKTAPKRGSTYHIPDVNASSLFWAMEWQDSDSDKQRLKRGQVHLPSDHAVEHARALILVSGGEV